MAVNWITKSWLYTPVRDQPFDSLVLGRQATIGWCILQRLANPMRAWNPRATLPDGSPNPQLQTANRPVNPYITIDSSHVPLTVFNGVESTHPSGSE